MPIALDRPAANLPIASVHRDAIAEIVESTRCDPARVERVYALELERLSSSARVTDYLVLFAVRRTREVLSRDDERARH